MVVAFSGASASPSRRASAGRLSLHHSSHLHLSSCPSRLVRCHFTWRLDPAPRPLIMAPPGAASRSTPLVRLSCRIAQHLGLSYRWLSCCHSSLPHVRLCLSFVTAFNVVCHPSRCHIHPVRHLLPQNGSGASPPPQTLPFVVVLRVSIVVVHTLACIHCQRRASPAIAVVPCAPVARAWPRGARLPIPAAGILRIPVFSVPVARFEQESRFLFRRNLGRKAIRNPVCMVPT